MTLWGSIDSSAIDLSDIDKNGEKDTISDAKNINLQLQDAAADLPGDANSGEAAIKTLQEQG